MKIFKATLRDKSKLKQLFYDYLSEFKSHREFDVSVTDSKSYKYLDVYWNEKRRHPLLSFVE